MLPELITLLLSPITWMLRSRRRLTQAEITAFYQSWEWKQIRYEALKRYGRRCLACNSTGRIVVDHIKPVRTHPHLRLKLSNLQTLCNDCNMGKASRCRRDWRAKGR